MSGELTPARRLQPLLDGIIQPGPDRVDELPADEAGRQERLATLGRFITSIAHDLNNMLTVAVRRRSPWPGSARTCTGAS